jgi:hypothetical protein
MYQHERSLVKKFENRPFALIGVNSDRDREKIQQICIEKKLTWRSFWNGGGTSGPISTRWNVSGWPTTYVIDHNGVIRARDVRGKQAEEWLDRLVAEAEATPPAPPQEQRKEKEK